jgi:hypothetical protein
MTMRYQVIGQFTKREGTCTVVVERVVAEYDDERQAVQLAAHHLNVAAYVREVSVPLTSGKFRFQAMSNPRDVASAWWNAIPWQVTDPEDECEGNWEPSCYQWIDGLTVAIQGAFFAYEGLMRMAEAIRMREWEDGPFEDDPKNDVYDNTVCVCAPDNHASYCPVWRNQ